MLNSMVYICSKIFRLIHSHSVIIKHDSLDVTALPESAWTLSDVSHFILALSLTHIPCELSIGQQRSWDAGLDEALIWPPMAFLLFLWGQIHMAYQRHKMTAWQHIFTVVNAMLMHVPRCWEVAVLQLSWSLSRENLPALKTIGTSLDKQILITEAKLLIVPLSALEGA